MQTHDVALINGAQGQHLPHTGGRGVDLEAQISGAFIEKVREVDVVTHNRLVQMVTGKSLAHNYIRGQYVQTGTSEMQKGSLSFAVRQGDASQSRWLEAQWR